MIEILVPTIAMSVQKPINNDSDVGREGRGARGRTGCDVRTYTPRAKWLDDR